MAGVLSIDPPRLSVRDHLPPDIAATIRLAHPRRIICKLLVNEHYPDPANPEVHAHREIDYAD